MLESILTWAAEISGFCESADLESFQSQKALQYTILHPLTLIGEAANQISPALRERHPGVPWRRMIDFRNRLIHGYSTLDLVLVWEVAVKMAPALRSQLELVLAVESKESPDGA